MRVANDFVLFALNRLHDRVHVGTTRRVQGLDQRRFAGYAVVVAAFGEVFIIDGHDGAAGHTDVAPLLDAQWLSRGSQIEWPCHGSAPI